MIERAMIGALDLTNDSRAKEANECLNVVPESEEIREAMKETRESMPGLDRVRIGYIRKACEGIQGRVIEIVRKMFPVRANEWDVPLAQEGGLGPGEQFHGGVLVDYVLPSVRKSNCKASRVVG